MQFHDPFERALLIQNAKNFITTAPAVGKDQNFTILPFSVQITQQVHQFYFIIFQLQQPGQNPAIDIFRQQDKIRAEM